MYPEIVLAPDAVERWLTTRTGAIVGRRTAERFGWKVGDRIPLQATVWQRKDGNAAWEFDLVGIYDGKEESTDTTNFFFRYDYFDEARAFAQGFVGWYVARVEDPRQAEDVAALIDEEFANSPWETKAETEGAFLRGWARQVGDITTIMLAILSAVFFTILLVTGNTMAQAVRERTVEIGVLKAIGLNNVQMLCLVLAESLMLALIGGVLGLGVAYWLISKGDPTGGALPMFRFPLQDVALGFGLVGALGFASGFLPAWQAMRLQIAEALRR
jgi:putative ABC transport system permease protein